MKEESLVIDGLSFMVPKTVNAVLRRLRDLPEAKSGMKFWIDAICIDQDNTPEKNHQVNLMWNIYATAFSVVAWLGECEDGSETAIDYMTQIMLVETEILRLDNSFSLPWKTSTYNERFSAVPWQTICSFLSRPYWTQVVRFMLYSRTAVGCTKFRIADISRPVTVRSQNKEYAVHPIVALIRTWSG